MIKAILTDIEGTTSSISFVKDVLFPYARQQMASFVKDHGLEPEVRKLLAEVSAHCGQILSDEAAVAQLIRWIDEDQKITPLKSLQGLIWYQGYYKGDFHGHIYPDALRKLQEWHRQGLSLFIFSSGSVQAQKLLFTHTDFGDLTPLIAGYFDTHSGAKTDPAAYRAITSAIGFLPEELLFLSDIAAELDAAKVIGIKTCQLVRDGTVHEPTHPVASDFSEIRVN